MPSHDIIVSIVDFCLNQKINRLKKENENNSEKEKQGRNIQIVADCKIKCPVRKYYGPVRIDYGPVLINYGPVHINYGLVRKNYGPIRKNHRMRL